MSAQRPQPGSDLSVAVAAQVGEQMVLELIAQVSARERQQWPTLTLAINRTAADQTDPLPGGRLNSSPKRGDSL